MAKKFTNEEIAKKFKEILQDQLGIDADELKDESDIIEDLGADSLDGIELIMAAEEEFGIEIDDGEVEEAGVRTVGDAIKFLQNKVGKA